MMIPRRLGLVRGLTVWGCGDPGPGSRAVPSRRSRTAHTGGDAGRPDRGEIAVCAALARPVQHGNGHQGGRTSPRRSRSPAASAPITRVPGYRAAVRQLVVDERLQGAGGGDPEMPHNTKPAANGYIRVREAWRESRGGEHRGRGEHVSARHDVGQRTRRDTGHQTDARPQREQQAICVTDRPCSSNSNA